MGESFSTRARLRSFGFAFKGLYTLVAEQHNARIHLLATALVIALGLILAVELRDWSLLLLAMGLVWAAEALNTAVEYLADAAVPEQHPLVARAKDVAAAGVLLAAVAAAAVGALVFLPYLL